MHEPNESTDLARLRIVQRAAENWKGQLVDVGGRNTLLYYKDLKQGTLDLQGPGSSQAAIARLLGSRPVRLSDVYPEGPQPATTSTSATPRLTPLTAAAKRARTVKAKATENLEERGIVTLFLAWGMATWTNQTGTATPAAPILLREAALGPRGAAGDDFELSLPGEFEINPTLIHFLATEYQVQADAGELLDLLEEDPVGTPNPTVLFERLAKVAVDVPGFAISERLVLGNFSYAKLPMVSDLEAALAGGQLATNDLLAAIAGDVSAGESLRSRYPSVTADAPDFTPPSDEFLVLDADASQSYAINTVVRGGDLVIEGPPGTGKSQTIANLIAALSARGQRTLFVAEKRAAIDAVVERLRGVGLGDLVFDLHDGVKSRKRVAQELSSALVAAESIPLTDHRDAHERLQRRRGRLRNWRDALHTQRDPFGLSVYEMQAELLGVRRTESLDLRLDRDVITRLGADAYRSAASELEEFVELGGFSLIVGRSPWRPAFERGLIISADQVAEAQNAVVTLATRDLPNALLQLQAVADECGLTAPDALSEWNELLALVEGVSTLVARYSPDLFAEAERLVMALAPGTRGALGGS